jgi:hypothetical protein
MENRPNTVSGLIAMRSEIAGTIEALQDQLRQAIIDLDNVDHTIHLFDPSVILSEIKSKPLPPRNAASKGEVSRVVLQALRNAKKPLTTLELAERVMAERGLDTGNQRLHKLMVKRVRACLRHWRTKGGVRSEKGEGQMLAWSVKQHPAI